MNSLLIRTGKTTRKEDLRFKIFFPLKNSERNEYVNERKGHRNGRERGIKRREPYLKSEYESFHEYIHGW